MAGFTSKSGVVLSVPPVVFTLLFLTRKTTEAARMRSAPNMMICRLQRISLSLTGLEEGKEGLAVSTGKASTMFNELHEQMTSSGRR